MDLDINNYTTDELLVILDLQNLPQNNITFDELRSVLFEKINDIKQATNELPDSRENLEKSSISIKTHGRQLIFMKIHENHLFSQTPLFSHPSSQRLVNPMEL